MANKIKYKWVKKLPVNKLSDEQLRIYFFDAIGQETKAWEILAGWSQRVNDILSEQAKRNSEEIK